MFSVGYKSISLTVNENYQTLISNVNDGKYSVSFTSSDNENYYFDFLFNDGSFCSLSTINVSPNMERSTFSTGAIGYQLSSPSDYINLVFQLNNTDFQVKTADGISTDIDFKIRYMTQDVQTNDLYINSITESKTGAGILFNNNCIIQGLTRTTTMATGSSLALSDSMSFVLCDPVGAINLTLPDNKTNSGQEYMITNKSDQSVTLTASGEDKIAGTISSTYTAFTKYLPIYVTSGGDGIWYVK